MVTCGSDTTIGALYLRAYDMIFCVVVDHDPMAYIAYALQGISLALIFTAGQLPNKFSIFPFSECHLPVDIRIWQWRLEHPRTPDVSGFDFVSIYASLGLGFATLMMLCHILRSVMGKLCHFVTISIQVVWH